MTAGWIPTCEKNLVSFRDACVFFIYFVGEGSNVQRYVMHWVIRLSVTMCLEGGWIKTLEICVRYFLNCPLLI